MESIRRLHCSGIVAIVCIVAILISGTESVQSYIFSSIIYDVCLEWIHPRNVRIFEFNLIWHSETE